MYLEWQGFYGPTLTEYLEETAENSDYEEENFRRKSRRRTDSLKKHRQFSTLVSLVNRDPKARRYLRDLVNEAKRK